MRAYVGDVYIEIDFSDTAQLVRNDTAFFFFFFLELANFHSPSLSSSSFLSSLLIPFLPLVLKSCLIAYLNRLLSHSVEQKRLTWIETQGLCQAQWCSLSAVKMVFNNVLAFVVIPAKLQDSPSTTLLGRTGSLQGWCTCPSGPVGGLEVLPTPCSLALTCVGRKTGRAKRPMHCDITRGTRNST